ncbi:MAG: hypothetical protein JW712_13830 [Dehalococcoidales bacterium]|nr:hypothetical protein [Dehalococcoidales bacterium]
MGVPGVFIACDTFREAAKSAAEDNAMPNVRYRIVSSAEFYRLRASIEDVTPVAEGVIDQLIDALTSPLSDEEKAAPEKKESEESKPVFVAAESYEMAAEEFNRIFLDNQWGDGLPMVPPTRERVEWMLSGTTRSPQEMIGKVAPKMGMATVEKIAINAVMAGAKPEYLPVILGIMEALTDENFDDRHVLLSAGSFLLLIVVSGPVAKEIGMEAGIGFMGHGWRPNNTIGRAVRLSTLNIGHIWPALNDMGLIGRISAHTFFTLAENAEMSRWAPYHTRCGFEAEDSCVTVASIHGTGPTQNFYGGMIGTWNADDILDNISQSISRRDRNMFPEWGNRGVGPVPGSGQGSQNHFVILFPELVSEYSKKGFDQAKLQEEIFERSRVPFEELRPQDIKGLEMALENGVIPAERIDFFKSVLKPGGKVPITMSPENIHLFVCGGAPGCAFSFNYYRIPPYNYTALMTKKIAGATLTKAGS